jgi:hypothetical protein
MILVFLTYSSYYNSRNISDSDPQEEKTVVALFGILQVMSASISLAKTPIPAEEAGEYSFKEACIQLKV